MRAALSLVRETDPPTMAVELGVDLVPIDPPADDDVSVRVWNKAGSIRLRKSQVDPRIDLVCMYVQFGQVLTRAVTGTPGPDPTPPACPAGWVPVAYVSVRPGAEVISGDDITEVRP